MKQIIQDLKNGNTILEEVPVPRVKSGCVLIQTTRTLVSLGTERMLVDFGKANFLQKAKHVSALGVPGSDTNILISQSKSFFSISSDKYSSAFCVTLIIYLI